MAFALQFDGVNDYVTVDFPQPFFNGSTYDHTFEIEAASVSGADFFVMGGSGSFDELIEIEPSSNQFRARFNNVNYLFDLTSLGLDYDELNLYVLRGWFDGAVRHISLYVNGVLVEQKDSVTDARSQTGHAYLGRINTVYSEGVISYVKMTDVNDSSNDRFYDARSTSTGSLLPETTANAPDGTLVNFPTDDSQWIFILTEDSVVISRGSDQYTPTLPLVRGVQDFEDVQEILLWLDKEHWSIATAIRAIQEGSEVSYAEPDKVYVGLVKYADGVEWNPGSGEGLYIYKSGGWTLLG